jgi:hypothetical protein
MGDIVDEDKRGSPVNHVGRTVLPRTALRRSINILRHHPCIVPWKSLKSSPQYAGSTPEYKACHHIIWRVREDGSNQVQMVFEVRRCHLFARQWKTMFRRETKDHEIESARDSKSAIPLQI